MVKKIKKVNRKSFLSKASIRRVMKNQGAKIISDEAVKLMVKELEAHGKEITKKALLFMKDEQLKRLDTKHIHLATDEEM